MGERVGLRRARDLPDGDGRHRRMVVQFMAGMPGRDQKVYSAVDYRTSVTITGQVEIVTLTHSHIISCNKSTTILCHLKSESDWWQNSHIIAVTALMD